MMNTFNVSFSAHSSQERWSNAVTNTTKLSIRCLLARLLSHDFGFAVLSPTVLEKGRLVYLDVQKTGSTFLVDFFCEEVVGSLRDFRKHWVAPGKRKGNAQLWVASVRNPFDLYVSLWSFNQQKRAATNQKKRAATWAAFDPALREACFGIEGDPTSFRRWLQHLFAADGLVNTNVPNPHPVALQIESAKQLGVGLATYRTLLFALASPDLPNWSLDFARLGVDQRAEWFRVHSRVDVTIRQEFLADDLAQIIENSDVEFHDGALERLQVAKPTNTSRHAPAMDFYDAATEAMVRQRDQLLLELFYPNL